jgi:hypothetical protein
MVCLLWREHPPWENATFGSIREVGTTVTTLLNDTNVHFTMQLLCESTRHVVILKLQHSKSIFMYNILVFLNIAIKIVNVK